MSWREKIIPSKIKRGGQDKKSVPEGLWSKCADCGGVLYRAEMERTLQVCPRCGGHQILCGRARLNVFLDAEPREELSGTIEPRDPLKFRDSKKYPDRLKAAQRKTDEREGMVVMRGAVKGLPLVACAMDFHFMGGSMASVIGELFVRAVHRAIADSIPLVSFSASGGARMQEGLFSLMQMAKTSAALGMLAEGDLPYISVLTHPTMGGVAASFAMLGDIHIAEPGALIGFAGPRVIEQTVKQKLPDGFQRSEFLLAHGAIDLIVDRRELRDTVHNLLAILTRRPQPESAAT